MRIFLALMFQQIRLGWRGGQTVLAIAFLFIAVTLLPFGIGPELRLLKELAPGLVWVVMLLTLMATLDRLFQADLKMARLTSFFFCPGFGTGRACQSDRSFCGGGAATFAGRAAGRYFAEH